MGPNNQEEEVYWIYLFKRTDFTNSTLKWQNLINRDGYTYKIPLVEIPTSHVALKTLVRAYFSFTGWKDFPEYTLLYADTTGRFAISDLRLKEALNTPGVWKIREEY